MSKKRLTIENRMLIEQLLRVGYKIVDIANAVDCNPSTISREVKNRRITGKSIRKHCNKNDRFPFVCWKCEKKYNCNLQKYYYNYKIAQEDYERKLKNSRIGIDMTIDELEYWNLYFEDKLKKKNQPLLHIFNSIEKQFPKSIQSFYNYVHKGYFSSLNDEMLIRASSYKPRKHKELPRITYINNSIRNGRTIDNYKEYIINHPNANIVQMDTVIGKFEDKKCILTLYFVKSKLMLMFLIKKYNPSEVTKIFNILKNKLGIDKFKEMFEVILTDNGWEFSKPLELEVNHKTGEKLINVFYCEPYSSWQKGGIERNHEFIRYIIPKGITFDNLNNKNITNMMNHINNIKRKSLEYNSAFQTFSKQYGEIITKKLNIKYISPEEVDLSYHLLQK